MNSQYSCGYDSGYISDKSDIKIIDYILETFECCIRCNDRSYHAVIGKGVDSCFICIPALGVSSVLADYQDIPRNTILLRKFLSREDAARIAEGISTLKHLKCSNGWFDPDWYY